MRWYPRPATPVAPLLGAVLLAATAALPASASSIHFDATGENSLTTEGYFGLAFSAGTGFIESFSLDLSGESGEGNAAFFDLDGRSNYQGLLEPVVTSTVGIDPTEIKIERSGAVEENPDHPSILTFSFLSGSFGVGDSLRFSVDTDYLADDPARGGALASTALLLTVRLEGGAILRSGLEEGSELQSTASLTTPIPEPATALFVGLGLAIAARLRRPRRS